MGPLFDKNVINTGRQTEADCTKAVCIVTMIIVHVLEELGTFFPSPEVNESAVFYFFVVIIDALFGASTFMFCMGFGIAFSGKNDGDSMIRRGIRLFFCAYLLNIARYGIPDLLNWLITGDSTMCREDFPELLLANDILQFAGLAFILFGFLKKRRISDTGLAVTALVMSALGSIFRNFDLSELLHITGRIPYAVVNQLGGLFFGTIYSYDPEIDLTCFPLMNWFIFVTAGYLFGGVMRRCKDKGRFYRMAVPAGAAVVAVYLAFAVPKRLGMMNENTNMLYHLTTPEALTGIISAVTFFGLFYGLSKILPNSFSVIASRISRNLTTIYVFQWVLIECVLTGALTVMQLQGVSDEEWPAVSLPQIFLVAAVIFAVSMLAAELIRKRKKNHK
ncbi:MAG: heparan-alpha-glucosaminide N-acetyltransferase domain-containing protein [Eubacteriales bacterium]|nr:heparan-alpha-glucosaminide N-acetyltransferase domain-containing protein [Eubacteriales bacterium]